MPVGNSSRQSSRWFRIANGKFIERVPAGTPQAVTRITKTNREVYELLFNEMTGRLVDIGIKEGSYEGRATREWHFSVDDGRERFIITTQYDSAYAKSLINTLAAVEDFTKTLCFSAWLMDEKKSPTGKPMSGLSVYYGSHVIKGGGIQKKFTREEMPEIKKVELKGEVKYDDLELCKFLENVALTVIKPKLSAAESAASFDRLGEPETEVEDVPF